MSSSVLLSSCVKRLTELPNESISMYDERLDNKNVENAHKLLLVLQEHNFLHCVLPDNIYCSPHATVLIDLENGKKDLGTFEIGKTRIGLVVLPISSTKSVMAEIKLTSGGIDEITDQFENFKHILNFYYPTHVD